MSGNKENLLSNPFGWWRWLGCQNVALTFSLHRRGGSGAGGDRCRLFHHLVDWRRGTWGGGGGRQVFRVRLDLN